MSGEKTKPIRFSKHALTRMRERDASEDAVIEAIRFGRREPAQRGLSLFRLDVKYEREWAGRRYSLQQIAPVVAEEDDCLVVVTVFTFYFEKGGAR